MNDLTLTTLVDGVQLPDAMRTLQDHIDGELRLDPLHRRLYAQDASVYQETPMGVVFPKSAEDVQSIVRMASMFKFALIPRAAGTSLAGQCVGTGLVVDIGRHMNQILELDAEAHTVRVQPGVILDDLNRFLATHGLFFGPDTSTSSRCMIGGMVGNNSCGSHSILYGTTRDHIISMDVVLSDGTLATISEWDDEALTSHQRRQDALGEGLRTLDALVREHEALIRERYPRPEVRRRNTGYAMDEILNMAPYTVGGAPFSLARLLCGSEGTLALTTEITLNVVDLPRAQNIVVAHFETLDEALRATVIAVDHDPSAVELVDKRILDLSKGNIEQARNRTFLEGDPGAILAIEFYRDDEEGLAQANAAVIAAMQDAGLGYAFPVLDAVRARQLWALRKAGLGILMGVPGDTKPVTVVEDTAVAVEVLPDYIREFAEIMERHGTQCVYYAHASVGELHLRPELNIKDPGDAAKFESIAVEVTDLVKKFGGSVSGEHGDGRLRSPMIEQFYGETLTDAHRALKAAFDPDGLLNPGKIVDPKPMAADWRFVPGEGTREVETHFDWSADMGLVRAVEKCNGAGACRKRAEAGGTMCPSYMVTLEEKDSTRGRANVFRHMLLENEDPRRAMANQELHDVLDLCLSCKGCKSECPASVDMGRMKAEFQQHHHDAHGTPLSARLFGNYGRLSWFAGWAPWLANFMLTFFLTRWLMGWAMKLAPERQLPAYAARSFGRQWRARDNVTDPSKPLVWLYVDPFTEYTEPEIALAAASVLEGCGYRVEPMPVTDDGRTYLSKGLLREAKALLEGAMETMAPLLEEHPDAQIVGLEPSALLTFRDEALDLVGEPHRTTAQALAERCHLIEEFVVAHVDAPPFDAERGEPLVLHGHCHQKALAGVGATVEALTKAGYEVEVLNTGCCGMAGSFGYEKDHYELSMAVGELVLFPSLRERPEASVAAPGTSCRHQIMDGVGRKAEHPAIWLERALR